MKTLVSTESYIVGTSSLVVNICATWQCKLACQSNSHVVFIGREGEIKQY